MSPDRWPKDHERNSAITQFLFPKMEHRKDLHVRKLNLIPVKQEGGYLKETFRSTEMIQVPERDGGKRCMFTTIYYMIAPEMGGKNYLQSNKSDAVLYFHDGWPAQYILVYPNGEIEEYILGREVSKGHVLQLRIPGGCLKGGKILVEEEYASFNDEKPFTLISEQVSPGFELRDRYVPTLHEMKSMYPKQWKAMEEYIAPSTAQDK